MRNEQRYPFVLKREFNRREAQDDPHLVDLDVEAHFLAPGRPSEIHVTPVDWSSVFGNERALRVEIGFGQSKFLIDVAGCFPEFNYIGFEYSAKRVEKFLRKVGRRGVDNVRAVCCDVTGILERVFAPGTIDRFFVLFPDPWPKRRHARNRFVRPDNLATVSRLLAPGGGITLRTDSRAYALQMLDVLGSCPDLENLAGPGRFAEAPREAYKTLYEIKYVEMGRDIYYLEYERMTSDL